jgi:hypothetical protein
MYQGGAMEAVVGCMDETATNYDANADTPCDNCCEYPVPPCCGIDGFEEYDENCANPQDSMCVTVGIGKMDPFMIRDNIRITTNEVIVGIAVRHTLEVTNVRGEKVLAQSGEHAKSYRTDDLEPGIYMVKVRTPHMTVSRRILVR